MTQTILKQLGNPQVGHAWIFEIISDNGRTLARSHKAYATIDSARRAVKLLKKAMSKEEWQEKIIKK